VRHHDEELLEGVPFDETAGQLEGVAITASAEAIPTREEEMERLRTLMLGGG
jgi:hypothetical protein